MENRIIKFRAWDKKREMMYKEPTVMPLESDRFYDLNKIIWRYSDKDIFLMQYTGLKDKNDKEIYEGDIVKFGKIKGRAIYKVLYQAPKFRLKCLFDDYRIIDSKNLWGKTEIIGNIYQNPNLII